MIQGYGERTDATIHHLLVVRSTDSSALCMMPLIEWNSSTDMIDAHTATELLVARCEFRQHAP